MRNALANLPARRFHSRLASLLAWVAGWMLLSSVSHAQVKNTYLYSEIPPDRMFSAEPGEVTIKPVDVVLRPEGSHLSLLNHVMTPSLPGAFIIVSASEEAARRLAASRLRNRPGATGYIYTIRADSSFYDVQISFRRFLDQQRVRDMDHRYPGLERAVEVWLQLVAGGADVRRDTAHHQWNDYVVHSLPPGSTRSGPDGSAGASKQLARLQLRS